MKTIDNIQLIQKIARGDREAFKIFYEKYADRLYGFIFHRLRQDKKAAEDVIQETMIEVVNASLTFRGEAKIFSWLCGIAKHKIADHYRSLRRRELLEAKLQRLGLPQESLDPEYWAIKALTEMRRKKQVYRALWELPYRYQEVLKLKYFEELSVKQIARKLDLSFKAAESTLSRARKAFREAYVALEANSFSSS